MTSRLLFLFFAIIATTTLILTYKLLEKKSLTINRYTFRQILQNNYLLHDTPKITLKNYTGNVPDIYLIEKSSKTKTAKKTCGTFPDFFDLQFQNDHWQIQKTSKGVLHLFNAYIDPRDGGVVRILATYDVYRSPDKLYCQYWYNNSNSSKNMESRPLYWMFHQNWGADNGYFHHPYLITCPLAWNDEQLPVSVSVVENPCDYATNNLKVFNEVVEKRKNFVVCVKGLSFPFEDLSVRLAEWIELLRLLGAEKINFYKYSVHPNTQNVLDYYADQGLVETTPITLVGDYSNHPIFQNKFLHKKLIPRRLQEIIPYNDCLYKHLQEFNYVVLLDIDEVIVPLTGTWVSLLQTLEKKLSNVSSFMARNVYFLDSHQHQHEWFSGIPQYLHMLQHVYRAKNYTKPRYFVKGFHDTTKVVALHNHFPFSCIGGCIHKEIDTNLAHLQHYRADCVSGVADCQSMKSTSVLDTRIWNFKDEIISGVNKTVLALDLLNNRD